MQNIGIAMWRGLVDSLRGAVVLFSMDKHINEKLKRSIKSDPRKKDSNAVASPTKFPKHQRYIVYIKQNLKILFFWPTVFVQQYCNFYFPYILFHILQDWSIYYRESKVLKRTIQCCALNGGVCWTSIIIFEYILMPLLKYLLNLTFGQSTSMSSFIWSWAQPSLTIIFSTLWVLPLFLLSRIVNSLWFQVIVFFPQSSEDPKFTDFLINIDKKYMQL